MTPSPFNLDPEDEELVRCKVCENRVHRMGCYSVRCPVAREAEEEIAAASWAAQLGSPL